VQAGGNADGINFDMYHNDYTKDKILEDSVEKRFPFKTPTPVNRTGGSPSWGEWHKYNKLKWTVKNENLCDARSQQVLDNSGNTMEALYKGSGAPSDYFTKTVPLLTDTGVEALKYQLEETCQPGQFDNKGKEWALWDRTNEMKQHGVKWGYKSQKWMAQRAWQLVQPQNPEAFQYTRGSKKGQFNQNRWMIDSKSWALRNNEYCDNTGNVTMKREVRGQNHCKKIVEEGKVPDWEINNFEPEVNYDCCWIDSDIGSNIEYKDDINTCPTGNSNSKVQARPSKAKNLHLCAKGEDDYFGWLNQAMETTTYKSPSKTWTKYGFIGNGKEDNPWQTVKCGYIAKSDARGNHDHKGFDKYAGFR
jgi:hypothetical protein